MLNLLLIILSTDKIKILMIWEIIVMQLLVMSIGQPKERYLQLRIKEIVDHAGHSVLLEYFNHGPYLMEKPLISQNNS